MDEKLLSRDLFRETVLKRKNNYCVMDCGEKAVDAHHILNRNLFTEDYEKGGYFLSNGAGLCSHCHLLAEATLISCEELYEKCNTENVVLPASFSPDFHYDTWGNIIINSYKREKGPLFEDSGFQKIAKRFNLLWLFSS